MIEKDVRVYETVDGYAPFDDWLTRLKDIEARAMVRARINRVRLGLLGDCKSLGDGVFELRIFYGPGYRIYFGQEHDVTVILLCGGDKKTQGKDIEKAKRYWKDYKDQL